MTDHFSCKLGVIQRSKGQSAIAKSAYRRGAAVRLPDGSVADFTDRTDVVASFVATPTGAPDWAADCVQLWTKAVAAEKRADAQEARVIEISIPRALPSEHWGDLARRLARIFTIRGMAVQVDIHCPVASDGKPNPHVHLMCTMREFVDDEFSPKKARHWNKYFLGKAKKFRRKMAALLNAFCRTKGVHYHADHRSNVERGLLPAEVQIPRWNILAHKRTGVKTPALEQRDEERKIRANIARLEAESRELEQELAAARATLMSVPAEDLAVAAPPKVVRRLQIKTPPMSSAPEPFAGEIMVPATTEVDIPGPRYGP